MTPEQSEEIRRHNAQLRRSVVLVGEATALAAERALSPYDRDTMQMAGRLLVKIILSQRLAEVPPPS